tara:strand:- start:67626 stop:68228 length:603 start_codon:yes stop_codon:yes gene_type:complete
MNTIPQPVDMSKLQGILSKAKAVMNSVNEGSYTSGNVDSSMITQDTSGYVDKPQATQQTQTGQPTPQTMGNPVRQPQSISESAINNSKLPQAIKDAMIKNPIVQSNPMMSSSFSLQDVSELVEPKKQPQVRKPQPQQIMNENVISQTNDKFTVSEASLRGIIKDVLVEYLAADYSKNLTEGVIKKTINTLIKEGKIKTKK